MCTLEECFDMTWCLEHEQVGSQQPKQDLPTFGENPPDIRTGPRDMPKDRHWHGWTGCLHERGKKCQMKIMNPYRPRLSMQFLQHSLAETKIHRSIGRPKRFQVRDPVQRDMTQRPQHLVGISSVPTFDFIWVQPDSPQPIGG